MQTEVGFLVVGAVFLLVALFGGGIKISKSQIEVTCESGSS